MLLAGIILAIILILLIISHKKNKNKETKKDCKEQSLNFMLNVSSSDNNNDYTKAKNDFKIAINEYEKIISQYSYQTIYQSDSEKIYCIDSHFYVYIGINFWNGYLETSRPHILIEELSYNDLFKFNATKFGEAFDNSYHDIKVNRFYGLNGKRAYYKINATKFFEINERFPELKLLELAENWEGVPCHFIIVELYDERGSAATIKYITNDNLEKEAQSFCKKIEHFHLTIDYVNKIDNKEIYSKLHSMRSEFITKKSANKNLHWSLRGHLRYFFVSERTTDYDLQSRGKELLDLYNSGYFERIDWREYGRFDGKWKSELLVFELCQKIYGQDNVLFQYSPLYLGKMSYDVYITSKKVAIEYQGKQHFEPVEFFGGQEHFEKQVERDRLKLELSKTHKVKLVYINYDEIISEELIKERVES